MRDETITHPDPIEFDHTGHHFVAQISEGTEEQLLVAPLSVILQVTRRCNLDCAFCSEIEQMPDPSLELLDRMRRNLHGVGRVFLSGGEPLLRKDIVEIAEAFSEDFIVGLPTNATPARAVARRLADTLSFVNIGLEGPRATTTRVRGDYDQIIRGIRAFKDAGLGISLSAVVLRSTLPALPYTYQIADVLDAGKLKLILPIRKGNGLSLPESEFISREEAAGLFSTLQHEREVYAWRPALRVTTWTPETEGYMILVYPNGKTYAWPVYDAEEKVRYLGNLLTSSIQDIWASYPFKRNHIRKYLGQSIRALPNAYDHSLQCHPSRPETIGGQVGRVV